MLTPELVARIARLKVADIADGARRTGAPARAAGPELRPTVPYRRICGIAVTSCFHIAEGRVDYGTRMADLYDLGRSVPYAVMLQRNDVPEWTSIGSGGARVATAHGYVGWVVDGPARDTEELRDSAFPVFATSLRPDAILVEDVGTDLSIHVELGEVVTIAGMEVHPGDVVVGDNDGVIVLPPGRIAEAVEAAERIIDEEEAIFAALDQGQTFREYLERSRGRP